MIRMLLLGFTALGIALPANGAEDASENPITGRQIME